MRKRNAARQRGVLIPVLFDNVSVPLGFASVQAAKLIGWDGDDIEPSCDALKQLRNCCRAQLTEARQRTSLAEEQHEACS